MRSVSRSGSRLRSYGRSRSKSRDRSRRRQRSCSRNSLTGRSRRSEEGRASNTVEKLRLELQLAELKKEQQFKSHTRFVTLNQSSQVDVFGDQTRKFQSQLVQQFTVPNNPPQPVLRAPDLLQDYQWSPVYIVPPQATEVTPQILHVPVGDSVAHGDQQVVLFVEGPVQPNNLDERGCLINQ